MSYKDENFLIKVSDFFGVAAFFSAVICALLFIFVPLYVLYLFFVLIGSACLFIYRVIFDFIARF